MNVPRVWLGYLSSVPAHPQLFGVILCGLGCCELIYVVTFRHSNQKTSPPLIFSARPETPRPDIPLNSLSTLHLGRYDLASDRTFVWDQFDLRDQSTMAQARAASWHNLHSGEDDPKWEYIQLGDKKTNFVKYRLFSHSDGCLEIVRSRNGRPSETWVLSPTAGRPLHQDEAELGEPIADRVSGGTQPYPFQPSIWSEPSEWSEASRSAEPRIEIPDETVGRAMQPRLEPETPREEAGSSWPAIHAFTTLPSTPYEAAEPAAPYEIACPAAHRGQYTWNWGRTEGCRKPQFRAFQDGSAHYQFFNVCTGVWDPLIHWTACMPH